MNNPQVKFGKGLRNAYLTNVNSDINNYIYFAQDTKEVFVGKKSYSGITNVTFIDNILTFKGYNINPSKVYGTDLDSIVLDLNDKLLSADLKNTLDNINTILSESTKYASQIDDTITTTSTVGAINKGTKAQDLKGKSFTELMDMIFFPTIYPVAGTPSITLTTMSSPQLIGTAITASSASSSFNLGVYTLNGAPTTVKVVGPGTKTSQVWDPSTTNIVEGPNIVTVTYSYTEGEQPKDNKGNPYGTPKSAGTLSKSAAVAGVYQYKYGVGDPTSTIPLTTSKSFTFKVSAEVASPVKKKHCFSIPKKYTVTKIELFNTLSNLWVTQDLSLFGDKKTVLNTNPSIEYTTYTRSDEAFNGEAQYRITFIY